MTDKKIISSLVRIISSQKEVIRSLESRALLESLLDMEKANADAERINEIVELEYNYNSEAKKGVEDDL